MLMNLSSYIASSVGKKSIMSLTGALLGGFLFTHLAGNTSMFLGRESFISYAEHLHSLGPLIHLFELVLAGLFVLHVLFAFITYFQNIGARPNRYAVNRSNGGSTFSSKSMPYTGVLIFLFIIVHLATFHFTDHSIAIADIVRNNLQNPLMCLYYIVSLAALGIHASHGFWSLFQSLGINHPQYNSCIRQGAVIVSVLGAGIYISIPVPTYLFKNFLL